jgi:hypothetical protein
MRGWREAEMGDPVKVQKQAKTTLTAQAVRPAQSPSMPAHEAKRPTIAAQLRSAARLGHSLGAIRVDTSTETAIQRQELQKEEDEKPLQGKLADGANAALQRKEEVPPNRTGLPEQLKAGVERLSGLSLDDVRVHYNSSKPAELQALAYAQGTEIHVAPGQERSLPHETWHVVQQKQGRVRPLRQLKGEVPINDDEGLEQESDVMGNKALQMKFSIGGHPNESFQRKLKGLTHTSLPIQRSRVLVHHYRTLEPPIHTLINYLAYWSSRTPNQVIPHLNIPLTNPQINALNHPALDRPDRVVAILDGVGAGARNGNVQTGMGHMGNLEDLLRGRGASNYDGGHLLKNSVGGFYDPITNSPRNLAPQSRTSNTYGGNWKKSEDKMKRLVNPPNPKTVFFDASVTYPDRTYTVPGWRMYNLVTPGTATANNLSTAGRYLFTTFHTWTPSQFNISFTANRFGQTDPTSSPHRLTLPFKGIGQLTNPITRQFFGTFLNAVQRFVPIQSLATTAYGPIGSDVVENQDHAYHGIMNEAKQDIIDIGKIRLLMGFLAQYGIEASSVFSVLGYIPGFSYFMVALEYIGLSQAAIVASPVLTAALLWVAAKQFSFIKRVLPNRIQYVLDLVGI